MRIKLFDYIRRKSIKHFAGASTSNFWPIEALRSAKGIDELSTNVIENDYGWLVDERANVYGNPKRNNVQAYQRVTSVEECIQLLLNGTSVCASLAIEDPDHLKGNHHFKNGHLHYAPEGHFVVLLDGVNSKARTFSFRYFEKADHTPDGQGSLPFTFFGSFVTEAWVAQGKAPAKFIENSNQNIVRWESVDSLGRSYYAIEMHDEEKVTAWAFMTERNGYLEVDEFFVHCNQRRKGYGTLLAKHVKILAFQFKLSLKIWVSHSDASYNNIAIIERMADRLDFVLSSSGKAWCASKLISDPRK